MKGYIFQIKKWFIPVMLLGMLGIAACNPDDDELEPMRMFTPAGDVTARSAVSTVLLTWKPPVNVVASRVTYTIEVASDTLFQTPILLTVQSDTSAVTLTDEQLEVQQFYFARVKANALDDRPESKWLVSSRFRITGEQILLAPGNADVLSSAFRIRWREYPGLTRIVITPEGGTSREVALTEADLAARMKQIEGLTASTTYRVQIYQGNIQRGFQTIRTLATGVAGALIDLTSFTDRPNVLSDTIPAVPNGSTIVLARGVTYNISTTTVLDKSLTITSENSFNQNLANIYFTSNFNVAAGSSIDSVVFRNVNMRSDNYASRYVFNINNASTIRKIKFDGTRAEIFRGIARLQSAGITVDSFIVRNSIIDSVSNYAVLTIDHVNATARHMLFKNSTFYKIERFMTSRSASNSITIDNCTFFEVPEGTRYLIDYAANDVSDGINVRNSIIGIGKALGDNRIGRGIRAGSNTLIESSRTYVTSDYEAASNPIPGVTQYARSSFALFQDPKNGNFTLIDPAFPGRTDTGDPRWRR